MNRFLRAASLVVLPPLIPSILVGCADPIAPAAPFAIPTAFHEAAPDGPALPPAPDAWWRVFDDRDLDAWIAKVDAANPSIRGAAARVAKARAFAHASDAARLPVLGVSTAAQREGGPLINALGTNGNFLEVGASLRYEVDVIGRAARVADAAGVDVESLAALARSTRLIVEADTAQAWFALRALDEQRDLLHATADSYRATLALVERRRRAGYASDLDLARLRAEAATVDADAIALDRRRAELEHALAFLAGTTSNDVPAPDAARSDVVPVVPVVPAGLPSAMLARRPDVLAAERSVEAARLRLGVAQTAWVPTFTLTGTSGYASNDVADLLRSSARTWGIAGLVAATIFDGGARRAGIEAADADLALATHTYHERLLGALRDVEDQLSALRTLAAQADVLRAAVDATSDSTARSASLYRNGLVPELELLDARRTELRVRRNALETRAARYAATVALIRALGGGWGLPTSPVAAR